MHAKGRLRTGSAEDVSKVNLNKIRQRRLTDKMKILFDHQTFSIQRYGGISRYFFELMQQFSRRQDIRFDLPVLLSNNEYLKLAAFSRHYSVLEWLKIKGQRKLMRTVNGILCSRAIRKGDYDILHPTYYDPYFLNYVGSKPFVLTFYDMINEKFPLMYNPDPSLVSKKMLAHKASHIIAISNNTKKDIIEIFGIDERKISVIHLATSLCSQLTGDASKMELPDTFLLFVGDRSGYKNFDLFIEAVAALLQNDNELKVVCGGGGKFNSAEMSLFASHGISERILYFDINDARLTRLYSKALAFVFPSRYEGFGIPLLEAMSVGCPVVCSNTSSFPEVVGNAGEYFDPTSIDSIRTSVENVLQSSERQSDLTAKGFERCKLFTWEKCAAETLAVYMSLKKNCRKST